MALVEPSYVVSLVGRKGRGGLRLEGPGLGEAGVTIFEYEEDGIKAEKLERALLAAWRAGNRAVLANDWK